MHGFHRDPVTRRHVLQLGAALPVAALAACVAPLPSPSPSGTARPSPPASPTPAPNASPTPPVVPLPTPIAAEPGPPRVLYRDGALADARSASLQLGVSILVADGVISWIRPTGGEEDAGDAAIVDAAGATFVPGMVDCHHHVTGPGGAHWIERFNDPPAVITAVAEHNGVAAMHAGVRWLRDVGSPIEADPVDGRVRALALGVRDRWAARRDRPYLRAAGSWLFKTGTNPMRSAVEVQTGDELLAATLGQLDDGADLVKLYMDGPDPAASPWTVNEVARVVEAAHGRGAKVAAHSGRLNGAREAVAGGVDSIEHGFELDADVAAQMASRGTVLVSTLAVMRSWLTFGSTTSMPRFAGAASQGQIAGRLEAGRASVAIARAAGVAIATGTDSGGGSLRANHLAWEVESLVETGLEPWEALAAATWRGGELLGEPEAGIIREGGPADFFLVHGDPLSEPAALWRVWRRAWD